VRIQPFMVARHPAYRTQLHALRDHPGIEVLPTIPKDTDEHERWQRGGRWHRLLHDGLRARLDCRRRAALRDRSAVFGRLPDWVLAQATVAPIHVDADDPVSVISTSCRIGDPVRRAIRQTAEMAKLMARGRLTLSFWTRTQLRHFLGFLPFEVSAPLLEDGRLSVLAPGIASAPSPATIGEAPELRCLVLPGGKFWPKGAADAIAAVQRAVGAGHNIRLTVLGPGVPSVWMEFLARQRHVRVIGKTSRQTVDHVFSETDLLLFLSHRDSYGWAMLEAKRIGVPTIATSFYNRSEIVSDGMDGVLVGEPFDSPFLPGGASSFAKAHVAIDKTGLAISPMLRPYVDEVAAAIGTLAEDRVLLRSLGLAAWRRTCAGGDFDLRARTDRLVDLLRRAD
jgi:glycosyltransferase involved in cell wall biosynthesis